MYWKDLSRKQQILIMSVVMVAVIICAFVLISVSTQLSRLEMFVLLCGLFMLGTIAEIAAIWWENRLTTKRPSDSPIDMIGKRGVVRTACQPEGTVKIGPTIWKAVSSDGALLETGDEVIVDDREGLRLVVRKATSATAPPPADS